MSDGIVYYKKNELDQTVKYSNYDIDGNIIKNKIIGKEIYAAKHTKNGIASYFVMCAGSGDILDPFNDDRVYKRRERFGMKLREVSKPVFDQYLKYLKTKQKEHLPNVRKIR